ncbi:hypothetical protein AMS68_006039 [Peltaster fructicola]|uniref:EamA domain-containing protein n=1 Tax=Peltaster fructicola TaxID=286661 RepID=A0A6H0Y0G2_9PEZI|nr:hypothetical protein AMS68_006039 [Peltaster fructicola]
MDTTKAMPQVATEVPLHDIEQEAISPVEPVERITVQPKGTDTTPVPSSHGSARVGHGPVEIVEGTEGGHVPAARPLSKFGYLKTKQFWIVLVLSQLLAVAITGTNTLTSLIIADGAVIPALQTLFNYTLLNLIYTPYTIYKYGFKGWLRLLWVDGWKFFILAFFDVEGNYFTVLAYNYTNILSAQLINFWAIVVVIIVSLLLLKVRYHVFQYIGILICCGGLGMLVASDYLTGNNNNTADPINAVKGDLFALLGATFYGLANVYEEFMVSKRPLYEVLGQLAFWAMFINGVQASIFDRDGIAAASWSSDLAGYLVGYTLILTTFYSLAPLIFRMASAAFFNIGLLTANFWGLLVGLSLFHLTPHWLYPVSFVLIIFGHFVYYGTEGVLGEARKPWLGEDQVEGVAGIGTAKREIEQPGVIV